MQKFKLSDSFLSKFKDKQPNWGFGSLSYFVYKRTYSRVKEDGTQEEFFDTIKRCVEGSFTIQLNHCKNSHLPWDASKAQKSAQVMFEKMWNFKFLPPGRGLWVMGTPIVDKLGSAPLQNCAFVSTKDIHKDFAEPFAWAADMLMLGVGVGYDTLGAGKVTIKKPDPVIVIPGVNTYIIPDTREGWVESIKKLLEGYLTGIYYMFDYSNIRPAGSPIKGFGGTASGSQPLIEGHTNIRKLLDSYHNKTLDSVGIVDIMNYIGKFVVAGNVRRSAEIALGSIYDPAFIEMKDPSKYPHELLDRRWMSNNSVNCDVDSDFSGIINNLIANGEPGIVLMNNARHYGRMKDGYYPSNHPKYDNAMGINPCVEQILDSHELCVSGDTKILTRFGYVPIKKYVGQNIEIWNGQEWSSVKPFQTGTNRKLYRVKISDGSYLDVTSNHNWSAKSKTEHNFRKLPTSELEPGFVLEQTELMFGDTTSTVTFSGNAYAWGFFAGDGYIDSDKIMISLHGEKDYITSSYFEKIDAKLYKEQHPDGYTEPFRRVNLTKQLHNLELARELNNKNVGIPEIFFRLSGDELCEFLAGWIDSDGTIAKGPNTDGYRIYGTESKIRDIQLLLRQVGINFASIQMMYQKGQKITINGNETTRNYDLWYCQISSFEVEKIANKCIIKKATRFGDRFKENNAYSESKKVDRARNQYIESIEELPSTHDTFCFTESKRGMGVFGNVLTYQCNLVESFPANHDSPEEYFDTLKYAYLYAKSVTLVPTHCEKTNQIMIRNRRIGCSQSGIQQAIKKFGIQKYLSEFCDKGYQTLSHWDQIYSRWLGIPTSIRISSVKPSGTISLLAGATPGIHCTHSEYYMRTIRVAANSPLIPILKEANYRIEESINDPKTLVIYFPVKEKNFTKSKYDISLWEQLTLVKELQYYWSDNAVSATITFKPEEAKDLKSAIEYFAPYVKALSFLPLDNHNYAQAPYQTITEEEYNKYTSNLLELDLRDKAEQPKGERYCSNDSCTI
jgi:hypothetical protein